MAKEIEHNFLIELNKTLKELNFTLKILIDQLNDKNKFKLKPKK